MVRHFESKKERLDFVHGKFTEIKPIKAKVEPVEETAMPSEEVMAEKPKAKAKPKAKEQK